MVKQTTPKKISEEVQGFLRAASIGGSPVYLAYTHLDDRYRASYCLDNCAHAAQNGVGQVVYGWLLWELRIVAFMEAEFHSVLLIDGKLTDITPRVDAEEMVLFVPDTSRTPQMIGNQWNTFSNIKASNGRIIENTRLGMRHSDRSLH